MRGNIHKPTATKLRTGAPRRPWRLPIGSASLAGFLLGAAVLLAWTQPKASVGTSVPAVPPPAWIEISHPIELFALDAPELANSPLVYEARRNRIGGGREDVLTFGRLDAKTPFLRLMLYRVGAERAPQAAFFVDLARMAAMTGLSITRSLAPSELATRFGGFAAADIDLAAGIETPRPCLGFLGAALGANFRISGFACGSATLPMSRPALSCLLDRLDLNSAGEDTALAEFFGRAELRRDPACGGTGLAPMPVQASWIDENDAPPPLRLRKSR